MNERRWSRRVDRRILIIQRLFSDRGWRRFLWIALVGLLIAVSLHAEIAVAIQGAGHWKLDNKAPATTPVQRPWLIDVPPRSLLPRLSMEVSETGDADQLVQQAEDRYQAGQISDAIALWQQAATRYETDGNQLNQSLVLSFLATAFADLGQWTEANGAIADSLTFIQNSKLKTQNSELLFAQILTTQGELQLAQGKASEALATWQQAESIYRKTNDTSGILGSQINQARALQADGLYRRSTTLLKQVGQSLQAQPDSRLKVTGLRNLGKMLRLVGDLTQSRTVLEQSLAIAQKLQEKIPASDVSGILFSLGNTSHAQGERDAALDFYQKAIASTPSLTAKTQIQLAQLSLLVEADRQTEAQRLFTQIQSQLAQLPPSRLATYARIDLARSAMKMSRHQAEAASPNLLEISAQELATAVQQIREIGDRRGESYALGTLGSLYENTQQWDNAKTLTQQALRLAQSIDASDISYQWQWQLGRIFCQNKQPCPSTEDLQHAMAAYTEAVRTLQSLRSDLAAINPDVQFSFRESVEPVYRQFVELLLQSDANPPGQENLVQARETIEALQLAELDNFFREACITASPVKIDQIDPQAAVIYPIILPNQFAVILSLPNQPLRHYTTFLPQAEVDRILTQLRQAFRPTAFVEDWLPLTQQVYDLLLRPVETELATSGIKTLVFVPDGLLRNLPMAALHDGQKYLIEKYSVVFTPGLQLLQPQPLDRQRLQGLLAGLTQARDNFAALPNVAVEIDQIEAEIPAQILLDQSFTNQAFQKRVDSTPSPIVHLATHGQFSSNADNTFILTWDGRINVKQLDQLLRSREGNRNPIELLVLSACQTATGDKRAALGMAGVAVRSGARSTLASLWSVSDLSTASLMIEFYRELGEPGITKAEALRRAQVTLLHQDGYTSPYYWAPFVLLGNWL
jgi:CHAT domain-containing protein